jgi:hypothetical protein
VDDFGRNGRAYRESDVETTDLETVILDLLESRLNTFEGWAQVLQGTLRKSFADAVICKCGTCRPPSKILSSATMD